MSDVESVIRQALARCDRILAGAQELVPLLEEVMPFKGADLAKLELMQRTAAVAYLKRFEQLQDLIARLTRAVASWEGADISAMTQRDLADWMEKRNFVPDAETWMQSVRLRNRLAHEYPIEEEEQILRLNACWMAQPLLAATLVGIRNFLVEKGIAA